MNFIFICIPIILIKQAVRKIYKMETLEFGTYEEGAKFRY